MSTKTIAERTYALGHSEEELQRLDRQGAFLRPFSQRILQTAGLRPGMRVLDLGCGSGDVSFLASELVGPSGQVLGVDRAAESIRAARDRAAYKEIINVEFIQADLDFFTPDDDFDAVIGRLVLMYLTDPAAALRRLAASVRPGGVMAFVEIVIPTAIVATGEIPLMRKCKELIEQALVQTGAFTDMGLRQGNAFHDAGLGWPKMLIEGVPLVGADPFIANWLTSTIRSMLPIIIETGIASEAEVGIDSLAERMIVEMSHADAVAEPVFFGGAWIRIAG